jgi:hypothetical protein
MCQVKQFTYDDAAVYNAGAAFFTPLDTSRKYYEEPPKKVAELRVIAMSFYRFSKRQKRSGKSDMIP